MNVLILGAGYVGSILCTTLSGDHTPTNLSREKLDYHNPYEFESFLNKNKFDYVVNCSGFTGRPNVDQAEEEKELCWKLNVVVPTKINRVCEKLNIPLIHISSGCIYNGYEKEWVEDDTPNFGVYSDESSFYSKTKHAYELNTDYGLTIRIRMPFDGVKSERSVLTKLLKYDNLVDFKNSKTYIPDLCNFINQYITDKRNDNEIINFVNPGALDTKQVIEIMKFMGYENRNWNFVNFNELNTKCNRSNCVLDITKLKNKYNFVPMSEQKAIESSILMTS